MHIGRLSALITPGTFALDDVVIEGRTPSDRPFFKAKRIYVHVPWWTIFRRQIFVELQIDDFDMVVESWAGGVTMFRTSRGRGPQNRRPSRFPTTDNHVRAWWPFHVRGSRDALERRRAQHHLRTGSCGELEELRRQGAVRSRARSRFRTTSRCSRR